jgi:polyisoprenoid-binding protein YceI
MVELGCHLGSSLRSGAGLYARRVLQAGTHRLGPDSATLSVHTERAGAAAKAGHDLLIHVTSWAGTIVVGDSSGEIDLELSADPRSLRVREGRGGKTKLDEADIENIHKTLDDEVLLGREIAFRSTRAEADGDLIHVDGELTLFGNTRPVSFELSVGDDDAVAAEALVKQSYWGMKPYSTLFGALKVADEVRVELHGQLDGPST